LCLRLPSIHNYLYKKQGNFPDKPKVQEMHGKNEKGEWNTTAAKEYPPSLCLAVALAIGDVLRDRSGRVVGEGCRDEGHFDAHVAFDRFVAEIDTAKGLGPDCMLYR
jgi:hypothetical protein